VMNDNSRTYGLPASRDGDFNDALSRGMAEGVASK
jgi:hypothetical protein